MISTISGCAASDVMQAAMDTSSLRAGTMAATRVEVFIAKKRAARAFAGSLLRFDSQADALV
jgi:hypothetical protein